MKNDDEEDTSAYGEISQSSACRFFAGSNEGDEGGLVGANRLDVARLLAFVANALRAWFRRAIAAQMTNFTACVPLVSGWI